MRRLASASAIIFIFVMRPAHSRPLESFTVSDEIALAHFNQWGSVAPPIVVSPNGRFVAVWSERGLLDKNRVEDEMRVYDMAALRNFVQGPPELRAPMPVLDLREATYNEGPIISRAHWLRDSSGLAFLLKSRDGESQLVVAGLRQKRMTVLSLNGQDVTAFDVRDARHYVYTVRAPGSDLSPTSRSGWVEWDGTGQPLMNLLFPVAAQERVAASNGGQGLRSILWAAEGGKPHAVARENGQPIVMYPRYDSLALSPGGQTLVTALPVSKVPEDWVRRFRPAYSKSPYRILAGSQNLDATYSNWGLVTEYVLIDLRTGDIRPVNGAPTGSASGWWELGGPAWAHDGKALLLPDAYVGATSAKASGARPCAAVFYLATANMQCLEPLKSIFTMDGGPEPGFFVITSLRFEGHSARRVVMRIQYLSSPGKRVIFMRTRDGRWRVESGVEKSDSTGKLLDVHIRQGLNDPPVLVASGRGITTGRVIWNPNPQLKNIALGDATVFRWKDATGRVWTGGLYKPAKFVLGRRYPLVIQTHGFDESEFRPSGIYPTAFAARALAASGMIVLQAPMCWILDSPREGPCNVAGYEAAVTQLGSQGLIDPNRIGIIGFSRTVYHVLVALTTGRQRFAAASVTDGVDFGYWQYLETTGLGGQDANAVIGARPFGPGLRLWLKRSPEFNMQTVHTPLLVASLGRLGLLDMWEPYAALRDLGKPVDLLLLNSDEHVLTNPVARKASQGGSVDWFRFWLQGYEDPDPAKAQQYRRWEKLCEMQIEENPHQATWCVPAKDFRNEQSKVVQPVRN